MISQFLLACLVFAAASSDPGHDNYLVIFDCGSSGTRLHVFTYGKATVGNVEMSPVDLKQSKVTPGISSYTSAPAAAATSIVPLIELAKKYVPKEAQSETKAYLLATAGMRLLPFQAISNVLDAINSYFLQSSNCPFVWQPGRVLSGEEEALYGYITANYATLGSLAGSNTVGIIDIGGASMQLSYQPQHDIILDDKIDFYDGSGDMDSIYGHSWMKYGTDQVWVRANEAIYRDNLKRGTQPDHMFNPCLLNGDSLTTSIDGTQVRFYGTGNLMRCNQVIDSLMKLNYECLLPPCTIAGTYEPLFRDGQTFYGISSIYNSARNLGLMDLEQEKAIRPADFASQTQRFCSLTFDQAKSLNPLLKEQFLRLTCFVGAYVTAVLDAFGLPENYDKFVVASSYRGTPADWSLGAALYISNLIPDAGLKPKVSMALSELKRLYVSQGSLQGVHNPITDNTRVLTWSLLGGFFIAISVSVALLQHRIHGSRSLSVEEFDGT